MIEAMIKLKWFYTYMRKFLNYHHPGPRCQWSLLEKEKLAFLTFSICIFFMLMQCIIVFRGCQGDATAYKAIPIIFGTI